MPKPRLSDIPLTYSTGLRLDERDRILLEQASENLKVNRNALMRHAIRAYLLNFEIQEPAAQSLAIYQHISSKVQRKTR